MAESVKDVMAKMLAEWLLKDFGLLLEEPTPEDIESRLEKLDEKR